MASFWMLGSNIDQVDGQKCGEIDILEYVGKEPNIIFTSLHTQDNWELRLTTLKDNYG
jgi:hypothetical protein